MGQLAVEAVAHLLQHVDGSIAALLVALGFLRLVGVGEVSQLGSQCLILRQVVVADGAVHALGVHLPRVILFKLVHAPDAPEVVVDVAVNGGEGPSVAVAEGGDAPAQMVAVQPVRILKVDEVEVVVVLDAGGSRDVAEERVVAHEAQDGERHRPVSRAMEVAGCGIAHVLGEGLVQGRERCRHRHRVARTNIFEAPLFLTVAPVGVLALHIG